MPAQTYQALVNSSHLNRRTLKTTTPLAPPVVVYQGRSLVNFSSNDYLNLSRHALVQEKAIDYIRRYGAGSPSSRLVSGNIDCYERIERRLAQLTGFEAALIFPSGYQLNSAVLPSILSATSKVFADASIHRSIIEGLRQARCRLTRFSHLDEADLERRLIEQANLSNASNPTTSPDSKWLIAESLYSVDGSIQDLDSLAGLANLHGAQVYLDEAHAVGLFGELGMGFAAGRKDIRMVMGCFSKALGSMGGYLLCTHLDKQFLINHCAGLIYTTALAPSVLGAIDAALTLIPTMGNERLRLNNLSAWFRGALLDMGFDIGPSKSHVVSIFLNSEGEALSLSSYLADNGILAVALRPPTTGKDVSAVRFSLTAAHDLHHIEKVLALLNAYRPLNRARL